MVILRRILKLRMLIEQKLEKLGKKTEGILTSEQIILQKSLSKSKSIN